jgi:hypothetical protein
MYTDRSNTCCMSMSLLHAHVFAACPCTCQAACLLYVNAACSSPHRTTQMKHGLEMSWARKCSMEVDKHYGHGTCRAWTSTCCLSCSCPCCTYVYVHFANPVHAACPSTCSVFMSMLHVHINASLLCPGCIQVHVACLCSCCMPMPCCMSMSVLHRLEHAAQT